MSKYSEGFKFLTKCGPAEIVEIDKWNFKVRFFETNNIERFQRSRLNVNSMQTLKDGLGKRYDDWRSRFQEFMNEDLAWQEERVKIKEVLRNIEVLRKGGCPSYEIDRRMSIVNKRLAVVNKLEHAKYPPVKKQLTPYELQMEERIRKMQSIFAANKGK